MPRDKEGNGGLPYTYISINPNRTSYNADFELEKNALHEAIEIKYFFEGNSTLIIGDETVNATAGDITVVNPWEFHTTIDKGNPEGRYHMLLIPLEYFSGEAADDLNLKEMLLEKRLSFLPHFKASEYMEMCILRIVEEHIKKSPFHHMIIRSLLLELFGLLLREDVIRCGETEIAFQTKDAYRSVDAVLRHIRDNYANPISLEEMASLCNLSRHYFCHLFKSTLGKTAMEYLREYRLKIAYTMLENTRKSVVQIAGECGFVDANYFSRSFKRYYGISPLKHREHAQESKKQKQKDSTVNRWR